MAQVSNHAEEPGRYANQKKWQISFEYSSRSIPPARTKNVRTPPNQGQSWIFDQETPTRIARKKLTLLTAILVVRKTSAVQIFTGDCHPAGFQEQCNRRNTSLLVRSNGYRYMKFSKRVE